jgi:hypothetical protein
MFEEGKGSPGVGVPEGDSAGIDEKSDGTVPLLGCPGVSEGELSDPA